MRVHNLYTDAEGVTHFRDIEVELSDLSKTSMLSKPVDVTKLYFRETSAAQDSDWHRAPRRQYLVNLDASVQLTASDGETRIVGPGEIVLLEDVTGKGHQSRAVNGKVRHSLFISLD